MTTDTFPKGATATAEIDGARSRIAGIAKGSGMIAPDMATMLAFVFTDAAIAGRRAAELLTRRGATRRSTAITVDSDTSTCDTLLLLATGGGRPRADRRQPTTRAGRFPRARSTACCSTSRCRWSRDGEGAQKFDRRSTSRGAASDGAARTIGLAIANSPLVKTAIAGEDANWGRIVMAVGKSGERADRDRLASRSAAHAMAPRTARPCPIYDETPVGSTSERPRDRDRGRSSAIGRGAATVWTCDLTHGYIDINADYRS